ncbi:MAG: vWA domain-containing protein [Bdellovibrionota bacterium]
MNDLHFASPVYLYLLLLLPALHLIFSRFDKNARGKLLKFLAEENLRQLLQDRGTIRDRGKRLSFWLGLALLILALARPQANPVVEEVKSSGLDIYVLLDVSRSMDCEDIAPSRLKKAKREIQHLATRLSGDRLGIIAFANSAVLVSPLTNDYSILDSYLQNLDTSVVPSQGTNMGNALETAKEAMERGAKNAASSGLHTNIFLVLSDGEDHGESDLSIVDTIRKEGGLIFTVAFGTEKGAPIPMRDDHGELRGYKKDRAGNVVVTQVKTEVLTEVAKRGGGQFYHATQDEGEVEDILARVNDAQRGSFTAIKTTVWEEYFWVFLAPALALLLLSLVPFSSLFSKLKLLKRGSAVLLLLFLPAPAHAGPISFFWDKDRKASDASEKLAKENKFGEAADALKPLQADNPDSPELNYDIGTYLLGDKKGRLGREQLSHLRNADGPLRDLALFNIAGSFAQEGKKDEARATYAELLQHLQQKSKLSSGESTLLEQTKRNVERLADPAQQPPPQKDQSDQKQDQNNQDQQKQGGDSQKQENKGGEGKDQDKKDQSKGDKDKDGKKGDQKDQNKQQGDEKKDQDKDKGDQKKDQDKGQGDQKKEEDKQPSNQGPGQNTPPPPPRHGGQPFKERDNMGEEDAKRILGALKERESDLQKKFLKNATKGGRVNVDDAAQDW